MRPSRVSGVALAVAATLGVAACGGSSTNTNKSGSTSTGTPSGGTSGSGGTINGAGSTFAAPIYQQWGADVASKGLNVNYQANGSGAGVAALQAGTVDFAGSDPPMKPPEIKAAKGPVQHFPIALGAITLSYNVPGLKTGLKLDGPTIANIYLGKIKSWNDPAIKALNPGLSLPNTAITPVYRSDSSGTTAEFTQYLSDVSPAWKSQVGQGKIVKFPTGTGAKGTAGVAASVQQTSGAIGYVEYAYALQNGFKYASVKNSKGIYILPSLASTTAAGVGIKIPPDLTISAINSPNATAYPIAGQTFMIVYKDMCKTGISPSTAKAVKAFIVYGLGPAGQSTVQKLSYAPLSPSILKAVSAKIAALSCNGSPIP
jgi:phosphate transport system substrate-binding protein